MGSVLENTVRVESNQLTVFENSFSGLDFLVWFLFAAKKNRFQGFRLDTLNGEFIEDNLAMFRIFS